MRKQYKLAFRHFNNSPLLPPLPPSYSLSSYSLPPYSLSSQFWITPEVLGTPTGVVALEVGGVEQEGS